MFKFCSNKQRNKCVRGDVLTLYEPEELHDNQGNALITLDNVDKNKVIGVVFAKDKDLGLSPNCGTSGKLHIMSLKYKNLKYDGSTMLPTAYPSSTEFQNAVGSAVYNIGAGENPTEVWRLFTLTEANVHCMYEPQMYMVQAALANLGGSVITQTWTDTAGIARNCCTTAGVPLSSNYKARPVITLAY